MRNKSCFIFFFRPTNDANNCNYWLRPIFYSIFVRGTSSERAWEKFSSKTKQINVNCYLRSIEWHHTKLSSSFNLKVSRICNEWIPNGDIFRESTSAQSSMKCHFYPEIVSSDNGIVAKSCVEIPARDFQSFPRSSRHLFTFSRVLFIITKFISFLLRLAFASNKYFPCFFFLRFSFILWHQLLSWTITFYQIRARAFASRAPFAQMMGTENGQNSKLFTRSVHDRSVYE